jgi:mannitol/fructose-specific phosphotransferase system IIA component (Ntr-type)
VPHGILDGAQPSAVVVTLRRGLALDAPDGSPFGRSPCACAAGAAVPHAILNGAQPSAVVVTLRRGLALDAPDGLAVRAFIVHVRGRGRDHARTLAQMARLADAETVSALCAERAPGDLVAELRARLE